MSTRGVIFAIAIAMAAALAGQAFGADGPDSTVVQGLVIQGELAHEVRGVLVPLSEGCLKAHEPDPDVPTAKLVSTFPAEGQVVRPGIVVVRLTYDLPMACPALVRPDPQFPDPCPYPIAASMISKDRRTFLALCMAQPSDHYGMYLDSTSLAGHRLESQELTFGTSGDEPVRAVQDAIAEDPFLVTMIGQAPNLFPQSLATAIPAQRAPSQSAAAPPAAPTPSDSTEVRGLVIQGRLSTVVQGLTVTPSHVCLPAHSPPDPDVPAPKLVSSFPANGAVVKPGIIVLRLTFDLPMACAGLIEPAFLTTNPCPAPLVDPVISKDRRTFMTVCVVEPHNIYGIWLNSPAKPIDSSASLQMSSGDRAHPARWTNLAGHELASRQITFTTSGAGRIRTLHDAIAEDKVLQAMVGPTPEDVSEAVFTGEAPPPPLASAASSQPRVVQGMVIDQRLSSALQGLGVRPAYDCPEAQRPADPGAPTPKLVSSFPADGGKVRPGIVVVRFTFDRPMACPGPIDVDNGLFHPCPTPLIDPVISADRRTFLAVCVVQSSTQYGMWLNPGKSLRSLSGDESMIVSSSQGPVRRWTSLAGRQLPAEEITFLTTNGEKVVTVRDAIAEDSFLRALAGPAPDVDAPPPGR